VQTAALKSAGCEKIFREKASGGRWARPEFQRLLDQLRAGDILVVWKLDRLSRSLRDALTIMERLGEAKVGFRSLTEAIDTTTAAGRMMMQMVGAFAEFERAMLRERTRPAWRCTPGGPRWRQAPQNSRRSSRWRLSEWSRREARRLRMPLDSSVLIQRPRVASWPEKRQQS
jgi:DNA invertase Pin-like site-specific DNA recombinase